MRVIKYISKNPVFQWIAIFLIYSYSVLVRYTTKWSIYGYSDVQHVVRSERPIIVAVWHGRILLSPKFRLKPKRHFAVISLHEDGAYVSKYMRLHGISAVRGSSKKGALAAFKESLKQLKQGNVLVITPDGPRGPAMKIGGNIIALAQKSDAVIIPYALSTSRGKFLNTWDRFFIPFPFAQGACIYGKPIEISNDMMGDELERARLDLEKTLNALTQQCDAYVLPQE